MAEKSTGASVTGIKFGHPIGCPCFLAAAAGVIAATAAAIVVACAAQAVATAIAEQENQDDDPANVTATETIVTHKNTSKNFFERLSRSFHGIPGAKKCAKEVSYKNEQKTEP